jgi:hypothetical protein
MTTFQNRFRKSVPVIIAELGYTKNISKEYLFGLSSGLMGVPLGSEFAPIFCPLFSVAGRYLSM